MLPFNEPTVLPAARLAEELGLAWGAPSVMERFQDKFALKEYLRTTRADIRVNASRRVESLADVLAARAAPAYQRFVLKPNSGFGNRNIAVFDLSSTVQQIENFLQRVAEMPIVMEEYIDGPEYFVNGQVDAAGRTEVLAIFRYDRITANGRTDIDYETLLLRRRDPLFDEFARYATAVVQAGDLRRSPFHLELKMTSSGPCLIEVGARLAGHGNALLCGGLHGAKLDLIDLAVHYYLHETDYGPLPLDWSSYDANAVRYVHGIATRDECIYQLDGLSAVEALPEFYAWARRPAVGMRLKPTTDLLAMPYSVILKGRTQSDLTPAADRVRNLLQWNRSVRIARRMRVGTHMRLKRYATGLRVRAVSLWRGPISRNFAAAPKLESD